MAPSALPDLLAQVPSPARDSAIVALVPGLLDELDKVEHELSRYSVPRAAHQPSKSLAWRVRWLGRRVADLELNLRETKDDLTRLRDKHATEPCCECGEPYPRTDLVHGGHITCGGCR